jgi:hypothetical protein
VARLRRGVSICQEFKRAECHTRYGGYFVNKKLAKQRKRRGGLKRRAWMTTRRKEQREGFTR